MWFRRRAYLASLPMSLWHLLSFSRLAGMFLFVLFPLLFVFLFYLLTCSSVLLLEWRFVCRGGWSFSFPVIVDKMSVIFSLVVVLISFSVIIFTVSYMSGDSSLEYFVYIVLFFILSINLLIFIPHLFFLLLGWDGLGLTSYLLVIYYNNDKSLSAGIITVIANRVGDSLLILAICWCFIGGSWLLRVTFVLPVFFLSVAIVLGAMTKRAQIPFSS